MIKYKIDVLNTLKNKGYSGYRVKKDKLFSGSTLQKFRNNEIVAIENIDRLCYLLECQPGDILEYVPDEENNTE
mgnify:CR=1 FL=1